MDIEFGKGLPVLTFNSQFTAYLCNKIKDLT